MKTRLQRNVILYAGTSCTMRMVSNAIVDARSDNAYVTSTAVVFLQEDHASALRPAGCLDYDGWYWKPHGEWALSGATRARGFGSALDLQAPGWGHLPPSAAALALVGGR
jgi:hypothetical protein